MPSSSDLHFRPYSYAYQCLDVSKAYILEIVCSSRLEHIRLLPVGTADLSGYFCFHHQDCGQYGEGNQDEQGVEVPEEEEQDNGGKAESSDSLMHIALFPHI